MGPLHSDSDEVDLWSRLEMLQNCDMMAGMIGLENRPSLRLGVAMESWP
jgi:hypothetical protein